MLAVLAWSVAVLFMLVGLIGTVVPLVPGTTLVLLGAVIFKFMQPATLSWWWLGWIAGVWIISIIADFAGVVVGTRMFGGSKWGMAGASGGALAGAFISIPALILGTVLGAVAAEKWLAKKSDRSALKAGFGAATGFVLSTFMRIFCAALMIALFLVAAWPVKK